MGKVMSTPTTITQYNESLSGEDREICELLYTEINKFLPEATSKLYHRNPPGLSMKILLSDIAN